MSDSDAILTDDLEAEVRRRHATERKEALAFLYARVAVSVVWEIVHACDRGVLVKLVPVDRLYFLNYYGVCREGSVNWRDSLTERFEAKQPRVAVGGYPKGIPVAEAIAAAEKAEAQFRTMPPHVPLTRALEEIIKLEWANEHGVFLLA